jgi:hypothetical protein
VVAVAARTDPNEQESVVLLPALDEIAWLVEGRLRCAPAAGGLTLVFSARHATGLATPRGEVQKTFADAL